MIYKYTIEIHPVVNFETKNAELYVVAGPSFDTIKPVVHNKHIANCETTVDAEKVAEEYVLKLAEEVNAFLRQKCKGLKNAEP